MRRNAVTNARVWLGERVRHDPGGALLLLALATSAALYAPTLGRGLVNYEDPWLVRDNWIASGGIADALHAIWFDFAPTTRFVLGAEYLPVRDTSILIDHALWGNNYGAFHATNLVIYLLAIGLWFRALVAFGVARTVAGLAVLVWAVHPSHAEAVAWLSERKGLLVAMFAGLSVLGYARFRAGGSLRWLVAAAVAAIAAVWSKAPVVFVLAALAPLDLVLPGRVSARRSLAALAVIAAAAGAAFVPVFLVAREAAVIAADGRAPTGTLAMALGLHGFYLQIAAMAVRNAVSYPIAILGPTTLDLVAGAVGLLALGLAWIPRIHAPAAVRAGTVLWALALLPVLRLVMPLRAVLVADRYLLLPTLGIALATAVGLLAIRSRRARIALVTTIVLAAALRTLDAQANWASSMRLWHRAVESNPRDGDAWSMYAESLADAGHDAAVFKAIRDGLLHSNRSPRLQLRAALLTLRSGKRTDGVRWMQRAAEAGEVIAMANLALLFLEDGRVDDALVWSRRATRDAPMYAAGHRAHGKVALAAGHASEALSAFERAFALERSTSNRFNLGLAFASLGRTAEAHAQFKACLADPLLAARARAELKRLP